MKIFLEILGFPPDCFAASTIIIPQTQIHNRLASYVMIFHGPSVAMPTLGHTVSRIRVNHASSRGWGGADRDAGAASRAQRKAPAWGPGQMGVVPAGGSQPRSGRRSERRIRAIRSQAAMCIRSKANWTRPLGSVSCERSCRRGTRALIQSRSWTSRPRGAPRGPPRPRLRPPRDGGSPAGPHLGRPGGSAAMPRVEFLG